MEGNDGAEEDRDSGLSGVVSLFFKVRSTRYEDNQKLLRTSYFIYFCNFAQNNGNMEHTRRAIIANLLKSTEFGKEVLIKGWVRTKRGNKQVNFIAVNDGSIIHTIQVVAEVANFDEELLKQVTTGACWRCASRA